MTAQRNFASITSVNPASQSWEPKMTCKSSLRTKRECQRLAETNGMQSDKLKLPSECPAAQDVRSCAGPAARQSSSYPAMTPAVCLISLAESVFSRAVVQCWSFQFPETVHKPAADQGDWTSNPGCHTVDPGQLELRMDNGSPGQRTSRADVAAPR